MNCRVCNGRMVSYQPLMSRYTIGDAVCMSCPEAQTEKAPVAANYDVPLAYWQKERLAKAWALRLGDKITAEQYAEVHAELIAGRAGGDIHVLTSGVEFRWGKMVAPTAAEVGTDADWLP